MTSSRVLNRAPLSFLLSCFFSVLSVGWTLGSETLHGDFLEYAIVCICTSVKNLTSIHREMEKLLYICIQI